MFPLKIALEIEVYTFVNVIHLSLSLALSSFVAIEISESTISPYLSPAFSSTYFRDSRTYRGNNFASQTPAMQDVNQRISALLALIAPGKITQESGNHFITQA